MAFIIMPVERGPGLLSYMGGSHFMTHRLHIWSGYAVVFWLLIHTALISIAYGMQYDAKTWLARMIPSSDWHYNEAALNFSGWIALFMLCIVMISSQPTFRNRWFNTFMALHILAIPFVIGAVVHDYSTYYFALGGTLVFVTDIVWRKLCRASIRMTSSETICSEQPLIMPLSSGNHSDHSIASIHVSGCRSLARFDLPVPSHWPKVTPGDVIYLMLPEIAMNKWHPYSVGFVSEDSSYMVIHLRGVGQWSMAVINQCVRLSTLSSTSVEIEIEGPYRTCGTLCGFDHYTFIAGGVGITGVYPHLMEQVGRGFKSNLVWTVSNFSQVQLFPELKHFVDRKRISVALYVTSSTRGELMAPAIGINLLCVDQQSYQRISKTFLVIGAFLGAAIGHAAARWICCFRPSSAAPYHEYSLFGGKPILCQKCDPLFQYSRNSTLGTNATHDLIPCCTLSTCLVCFRTLPILLSTVLACLGTCLMVFTVRFLAKGGWGFSSLHYAGVDSEDEESNRMHLNNTSGVNSPASLPPFDVKIYHRPDIEDIVIRAASTTSNSCIEVCGPSTLCKAVTASCTKYKVPCRVVNLN
jgi:predicted ferric reductase